MKFIGSDIDIDVLESMKTYLPKFYEQSKTVNEILRVDSEEIEDLFSNIDNIFNEFFINTADSSKMSQYETIFGIITDNTKDIEQRRSVLFSKVRGFGTTTIEMIKTVAQSYLNGEVDIKEQVKNKIRNFNDSGWTGTGGTFTVETSNDYSATLYSPTTSNIVRDFSFDVNDASTFTASAELIQGKATIKEYKLGSYNGVSHDFTDENPITFTIKNDTDSLMLEISSNSQIGSFSFSNIQIERGTIKTDFQPLRDYEINIVFVSKHGNPPNLNDIKQALRDVTPAHLNLTYTLTYLNWDELDSNNFSWNLADTYKWDDFEKAFI